MKINWQKITVAIAMLLGLAVLGAGSVYADEGEDDELPPTYIQMSPTAVTITLEGGDVITGNSDKCPTDVIDGGCVVEIKNVGSQAFRYKVYASPYVVKGEDYSLDFSESASTTYTQISRWINFANENGGWSNTVTREIQPGETQTIAYRIDVPEDVPGGAQYAVIWAQTINDANGGSSGVSTLSQAGMVISGRSIGDTRQTADVYDYDFMRFTFGGALTAQAVIKNTGNADFEAHYNYSAKTLFGKEIYEDSGSIATFPDTEYHVNVNWENTPFLGIFRVTFALDGADARVSESHIVVIMPLFIMILLILLLTVVIVWIIIIIRKRKERKARTLV